MLSDAVDRIAVRELVEFTAKSGDLDMRFTPGPTAQQGIAGHQLAASRRGPLYQREVRLEGRHAALAVRGRADGYDPAGKRLEEFKTFRGDLGRLPDNHRALHWAQLKIYGALWCKQESVGEIELALVYVDVGSGAETVLAQSFTSAALAAYFADSCEAFLAWAAAQRAHRRRRDEELAALRFPHAELRAGQRELAESIYKAVARRRSLMAQAPTGIGKTLGSLFPALKAAPDHGIDKLLFLVAKTSGRRLAVDALRLIGTAAPALRGLEVASKEAACEYPGRVCSGASCPLAAGFYERLPAARSAALELGLLDRAAVRRTALRFAVCPYYLTQELLRWTDVIVADYNYYFDANALLYSLCVLNEWRAAVLVDEAHNLVARARDMYSATLAPARLAAAAAAATPPLRTALARVSAAWLQAHRDQLPVYQVHAAPPPALLGALQRFTAALGEHLAAAGDSIAPALLDFYFDALFFCRMAETFGEHSLFDVSRADGPDAPTAPPRATGTAGKGATRTTVTDVTRTTAKGATGTVHATRAAAVARMQPTSVLCIRNVVPAPFLAPRFAASAGCVLFSATLAPADFYRRLLGLPDDTGWLDVPSPFEPGQLTIHLSCHISTRFRDRQASAPAIVALIARQFRADPGNYLAFFSSFEYLAGIAALLRSEYPEIPTFEQARGGGAAAREQFLARFTPGSAGIGFAVLGGVFAEGVDLPGDRLIGAFIATLGLPQINAVNAEFARRLDALFGSGYEYTYLYPGLQKVIQAAGRVIRTSSDRGTLHLLDDRYAGREVRDLLPRWWRLPA
jgi:Rad3-related DNA helicase